MVQFEHVGFAQQDDLENGPAVAYYAHSSEVLGRVDRRKFDRGRVESP